MLNAKTKFGFKKGHVRRAVHPNFGVYTISLCGVAQTSHAYIHSAHVGGGGELECIMTYYYYYSYI